MPEQREITIIGSGPAGYTAAIYAARAGFTPLVFTGAPTEDDPQRLPGGQLASTTEVENYPGFPDPVDGSDLVQKLEEQASRRGAELVYENVLGVELGVHPFEVRGESTTVRTRSVIVATGASARWLGVPGEREYRNRGVSACATCDGALFKGRDVLVVGGGDTALHEAIYLSKLARSVRLVHRRSEFSANEEMARRVRGNPAIRLELDTVVESIFGDAQGVRGVRVRHLESGRDEELSADGVFVAIGHVPATALFRGQLELTNAGYVVTQGRGTSTSVPGVFAAGDVQDPRYRQAITAAASGAMAALDAERWLGAALAAPQREVA